MWGWDNRPGAAGTWRLREYDEATPHMAKIIPLRPWFDQPPPRAEDPPVVSADEKAAPAQAKVADPPAVEPSLREEAKTPAPGSTVVIEQQTPAPPLQRGGDRGGGGSSGGGGGGGGTPRLQKRS